jgi:hypothetical protein
LSGRDIKAIVEECGTEVAEYEGYAHTVLSDRRRFGEYAYLHYERRRHHWHLRPSAPRAA